jgi:hypothetical protein
MHDSVEGGETASFVIAGVELKRVRKALKPVVPSKSRARTTNVTVAANTTSELCVQLLGKAVLMPAVASRAFTARIPWLFFKQWLAEIHGAGSSLEVTISNGVATCNRIRQESPRIRFVTNPGQIGGSTDNEPQIVGKSLIGGCEAPQGPLVFGVDGNCALPLLAAYASYRRNGVSELQADRAFVEQQLEAIEIVKKAALLLKPLGVTREDIEEMVDQRAGKGGR